jgi:nucleotide-binding universal stress UspA family protein
MRHILVAIDEDPFAEHVILAAGQLAKVTQASITVCHVMPEYIYRDIVHQQRGERENISSTYSASFDFYFRTQQALDDAYRENTLFTIDQAMAQAKEAAEMAAIPLDKMGIKYETTGLVGQPSQELVACAHRLDADLIVIGFEALHGLQKLRALGSVARALLEHAPCLVLTVPLDHATSNADI